MDRHQYPHPSGNFTINWEPKKCAHAGICVKMLPKVYNPKERPWCKPENATVEQIKNQIDHCPSGALSYEENQENTIKN